MLKFHALRVGSISPDAEDAVAITDEDRHPDQLDDEELAWEHALERTAFDAPLAPSDQPSRIKWTVVKISNTGDESIVDGARTAAPQQGAAFVREQRANIDPDKSHWPRSAWHGAVIFVS